jgi:hypothetical protein
MHPRRIVYPAIERRPGISRDSLVREYMLKNKPVVVSLSDVAWCAGWTPSALRDRFSAAPVVAEDTRHVYVGERAAVRTTIAELVDAVMRGDQGVRWKGLEFLSRVPAMREALERAPSPLTALMPRTAYDPRTTLWVAPAKTMSSLHHDGNLDNLNLQVSGKKLWLLIPPAQHDRLYLHGSAESAVNPFTPDLRRFPRFADATPLEATLHPGEIILVPKYWWHCVYAIEPSVNLATCFRWHGEMSAWRALAGAPHLHRTLTALSAELKKRGFTRLANAARHVWNASPTRTRPPPQSRAPLAL